MLKVRILYHCFINDARIKHFIYKGAMHICKAPFVCVDIHSNSLSMPPSEY